MTGFGLSDALRFLPICFILTPFLVLWISFTHKAQSCCVPAHPTALPDLHSCTSTITCPTAVVATNSSPCAAPQKAQREHRTQITAGNLPATPPAFPSSPRVHWEQSPHNPWADTASHLPCLYHKAPLSSSSEAQRPSVTTKNPSEWQNPPRGAEKRRDCLQDRSAAPCTALRPHEPARNLQG